MKPKHQSILPIFYALLLQKEKLVLWKERMMMTLHMFGNKERKRKEKKLVIFSLFGLQKGAAGLHYTFLSIYTDIGWLREGRPRWITFAMFFSYQPNSGNPTNPFISFLFRFLLLVPNVHDIHPNKANFFELTIMTLNSRSIIYN